MYIWEVAAREIVHLGSCHLGKYPWEVTAWEKAFEKVPYICIQCRRLSIFQTINAVRSNSLTAFTPSGCKEKENIKL